MKKQDISHWTKSDYFTGMLLFVQTIEENTFHYSYESYKLPALNCHYLCYDIMYTARDINRKILMDGNFIPLSEEFEQMLAEDLFVKNEVSDNNTLLLSKDKNANFHCLSGSDLKTKIKHYPEIAAFVSDICEIDNYYYLESLIETVVKNIFVDTFTFENSDIVYKTTRMIVTELVNKGYSKEYIYSTVNEFFYNPLNPIDCSKETISDFFEFFPFIKANYQAIFGINSKAAFMFEKISGIQVRNPTAYEKKVLNLQRKNDYVAILEVEEIDPFSAFEKANYYIETIQSLHNINQHNNTLYISSKAIVSKELEDGSFEVGKLSQTPQNPMKKRGNTSDLHAIFNDVTLLDKINPPTAFFRAISLHHGALKSKDISNQLLNLWTIIEILIDTRRDSEDRINTICATLCSILNRRYLYSNLEQLLNDINSCSTCDFEELIKDTTFGKHNNLDLVKKFALVLTLKEFSSLLDILMVALSECPLLKYRVEYFANYVLVDSTSILEYLQRHERRIRWHIMRIYRNRNMIVHSGSYMPYLNIIVENLHFYADALIDTLIEYYHMGLMHHSSIYKNIIDEELSHYIKLGVSLVNKKRQEKISLTLENALDLIFNGYSGSPIKKDIDRLIAKRRSTSVTGRDGIELSTDSE